MIRFFPKVSAQAHCDIPCGVYEPTLAKIAAKTVLRMVEQLEKLSMPEDLKDKTSFKPGISAKGFHSTIIISKFSRCLSPSSLKISNELTEQAFV